MGNLEKAFLMGKEAFIKGLHPAPCMNKELMDWIKKDLNSWDKKVSKKAIEIMRQYIRGWDSANLLAE